jgi:hypothetical protein
LGGVKNGQYFLPNSGIDRQKYRPDADRDSVARIKMKQISD